MSTRLEVERIDWMARVCRCVLNECCVRMYLLFILRELYGRIDRWSCVSEEEETYEYAGVCEWNCQESCCAVAVEQVLHGRRVYVSVCVCDVCRVRLSV